MTDTETPLTPAQSLAGIVPVWLLAVAGAVIVGLVVAPADRFGGLSFSLAVCTLAAFCVQLAVRRREGFVARAVTSVVGAVVITAVAGIVVALTL